MCSPKFWAIIYPYLPAILLLAPQFFGRCGVSVVNLYLKIRWICLWTLLSNLKISLNYRSWCSGASQTGRRAFQFGRNRGSSWKAQTCLIFRNARGIFYWRIARIRGDWTTLRQVIKNIQFSKVLQEFSTYIKLQVLYFKQRKAW